MQKRIVVMAKELQPGDRIFHEPVTDEIPTTKQLRTDLVTGVGLNLCCGTVDISIHRGSMQGTVQDMPMDLEIEILRPNDPELFSTTPTAN